MERDWLRLPNVRTPPEQGPRKYSVPMQPSKHLHLARYLDGWCVWLMGSPHTKHMTYLYLKHDGTQQRWTVDQQTGDVDVLSIRADQC